MTTEQKKQSILDCADDHGQIWFDSSPPPEASELVKEGRLVRIGYFVYSLPEGG